MCNNYHEAVENIFQHLPEQIRNRIYAEYSLTDAEDRFKFFNTRCAAYIVACEIAKFSGNLPFPIDAALNTCNMEFMYPVFLAQSRKSKNTRIFDTAMLFVDLFAHFFVPGICDIQRRMPHVVSFFNNFCAKIVKRCKKEVDKYCESKCYFQGTLAPHSSSEHTLYEAAGCIVCRYNPCRCEHVCMVCKITPCKCPCTCGFHPCRCHITICGSCRYHPCRCDQSSDRSVCRLCNYDPCRCYTSDQNHCRCYPNPCRCPPKYCRPEHHCRCRTIPCRCVAVGIRCTICTNDPCTCRRRIVCIICNAYPCKCHYRETVMCTVCNIHPCVCSHKVTRHCKCRQNPCKCNIAVCFQCGYPSCRCDHSYHDGSVDPSETRSEITCDTGTTKSEICRTSRTSESSSTDRSSTMKTRCDIHPGHICECLSCDVKHLKFRAGSDTLHVPRTLRRVEHKPLKKVAAHELNIADSVRDDIPDTTIEDTAVMTMIRSSDLQTLMDDLEQVKRRLAILELNSNSEYMSGIL